MKRAVVYARVSGDDRNNEGRNLAGQIEMGRNYATERGYTVVAELAEDDRGASGAVLDLPQLNRLREMAEGGEFDVLVVREIDRLSRNLAKQLLVEEELKGAGVTIEYVLGEYPDTPEGNLMKHIKASVAEYERLKISERMIRGRRQKVKAGYVLLHGKKPSYGYRMSEDGKTLVVHEPEARIIRLAFTWYADGDGNGKKLGGRAIARRLTEMHVPTWRDIHGTGGKKVGYGVWSMGTISRVLSNETYTGLWHYGQRKSSTEHNPRSTWLTVEVPRIIDGDLWDRAQEQKASNKAMAKRNAKHEYLVGRRVTCGKCGSKMHGISKRVPDFTYRYYQCAARKGELVGKTCDIPGFRADHVDGIVWDWVSLLMTDPEALATGLRARSAGREKENAPLHQRLTIVDDLLAQNRDKLDRLIDLYLSGEFTKEALANRKSALEQTIADLVREREGLTAQLVPDTLTPEQIETITQFAQRVAASLDTMNGSFEKRCELTELLDLHVTLAIEDREKVVRAACVLGEARLSVVNSNTVFSGRRNRWSPWFGIRGRHAPESERIS